MSKKQLGKTDIMLSQFAIGTATFGNVYGKMQKNVMNEVVDMAIKNNLNYFDTSPYYGKTLSEINLGDALQNHDRNTFIVSTKVGRYGDDIFDFSASTILTSLDDSLKRLKLDYVDILLLHDIEYGNIDVILNEALPALQKIKNSGKARYIGFSCYPVDLIKKVIEKSHIKIDVILSYAHYCMLNNKLDNIIPFLKDHDVGIINASPLCMGLLSTNPVTEWHPAPFSMSSYIQHQSLLLQMRTKVKIENYALNYVLYNSNISTTLVGIRTLDELKNIIVILKKDVTFNEDIYVDIFNFLDKYHNVELE